MGVRRMSYLLAFGLILIYITDYLYHRYMEVHEQGWH